jgi:hypothetical protein
MVKGLSDMGFQRTDFTLETQRLLAEAGVMKAWNLMFSNQRSMALLG